jgi:hypothetical protein
MDEFETEMIYYGSTLGAICVSLGDENEAVWLPWSQIRVEESYYGRGDRITVTMPQWLAEEKRLA